jgi:uncharacterized membrane protein YphA (DoxX/SURF4 family)
MDDSIAHPGGSAAAWPLAGWKTAASGAAGVLVGILFLIAGVWKLSEPFNAAARLTQALVPANLSLIAACMLGIAETFAGALLFVPRFRRWGAWLASLLLVAFLVYIGYFYNALRGEECNCFPWVKRAVGPGFFIGDFVMLALAVIAGWWARPSTSRRCAALILAVVTVFASVSYGVNARVQASAEAPRFITVNGQQYPMRLGRVFVYFFDPMCTHCDAAAREMAKMNWSSDVKIIAVPTDAPRFAADFMRETGLKGMLSYDTDTLRKSFTFTSSPYAVALENGRLKAAFSQFDQKEPEAGLRRLGFIH